MATAELLQEYMADLENVRNIDALLEPDSPTNIIWSNLIWDDIIWKNLRQNWDADADLLQFLTVLSGEERERYFRFGVECVLAFVQANFTGPKLPKNVTNILYVFETGHTNFATALSKNSEQIHPNTVHPILFFVARRIFKLCKIQNLLIQWWWQLRSIIVHQQILEGLSESLFAEAQHLCVGFADLAIDDRRWKALLEIEQGQLFNVFKRPDLTRKHLEKASQLLGIAYELNLDKSIRYCMDSEEMPVLWIDLPECNDIERPAVDESLVVPENLNIHEEVRDKKNGMVLPDLEQKFLLAALQEMTISTCDVEQIMPIIDVLGDQENTWTVRTQLLILRTQIESKYPRTFIRARKQAKIIIAAVDSMAPHALNRVGGVFACNLAPLWRTKSLEADALFNYGLEENSLLTYKQLQLWDEVVKCYVAMGKSQDACEVIESRLQITPTVALWCLFGDAAKDVSCYEKAWEVSNRTSSMAQRLWGDHFFETDKLEECILHFETSLEINSLQPEVLRKYAYALLKLGRWGPAVDAYNRYTVIAPHDREGWNNLGKAYIKLGNKVSACDALSQAVKCDYYNLTILNNFVLVNIDIGRYIDAFYVYKRMVELQPTHLDLDVLAALVFDVCENSPDYSDPYLGDLIVFMDRMVSVYRNNGHLWNLFASLATEPATKIARLQKALEIFTEDVSLIQDREQSRAVLQVCHKLAEVVLSNALNGNEQVVARVNVDVTKTLRNINTENGDELADLHRKVTKLVEKVTEKIRLFEWFFY